MSRILVPLGECRECGRAINRQEGVTVIFAHQRVVAVSRNDLTEVDLPPEAACEAGVAILIDPDDAERVCNECSALRQNA